jgi:hypothetical protein
VSGSNEISPHSERQWCLSARLSCRAWSGFVPLDRPTRGAASDLEAPNVGPKRVVCGVERYFEPPKEVRRGANVSHVDWSVSVRAVRTVLQELLTVLTRRRPRRRTYRRPSKRLLTRPATQSRRVKTLHTRPSQQVRISKLSVETLSTVQVSLFVRQFVCRCVYVRGRS